MRRDLPHDAQMYRTGDIAGKHRVESGLRCYMRTDPYYRMRRAVFEAMQTTDKPIELEGKEVALAAMDYLSAPLEHESERQFWGRKALNAAWSEYKDDLDRWERFVYGENLVAYVYLYQSISEGCDTDYETLMTFIDMVNLQIDEVAETLQASPRPCFAVDHDSPPPGWHLHHATPGSLVEHKGQTMAVVMSGPLGAFGQPTADCRGLIASHAHKPQLRGLDTD